MAKPHRMHIGHLIKDVFDKKGMSVTEFARRIIQLKSGMDSMLQTRHLHIDINLESFSAEKTERVSLLLKELAERGDNYRK